MSSTAMELTRNAKTRLRLGIVAIAAINEQGVEGALSNEIRVVGSPPDMP